MVICLAVPEEGDHSTLNQNVKVSPLKMVKFCEFFFGKKFKKKIGVCGSN